MGMEWTTDIDIHGMDTNGLTFGMSTGEEAPFISSIVNASSSR
jgi:hypothetical protein